MKLRVLFQIGVLLLLITSQIRGQYTVHHYELKWNTINTEHFQVHYHEGAERTARLVAKIAEELYHPVTSVYNYKPDGQIHFIIRDHDDYSNGAAFFYNNKVEVWANPMAFPLRGTANWLRNVVTHEFTHMISLGAARKAMRTMPAIYLQYMGYEPEHNPYVLRGFPHQIVSYPITMTTVPMWLAEGVAQFQLPGLNYDHWDTHRDMILRTAVLEDNLLDAREMCVFGDNSIRNEKVYNQGYSMVQYLVTNHGLGSLQRIMHAMKTPWRFTINGALKNAIGLNEAELYTGWKANLKAMYDTRLDIIKQNLVTGDITQDEGKMNFFPTWDPEGKRYAFISNRGKNSIYRTTLYLYDSTKNQVHRLKKGVNSSMSWSKDGNQIAYSRISSPTRNGSQFQDIFIYDVIRDKERQLTHHLRAKSPDLSPNEKEAVFTIIKDGTQNLAIGNIRSATYKKITNFYNGEQIYSPRFSPDGNTIIFTIARRDNRDIARINADGSDLTYIIDDDFDSRDPVFTADGRHIYFSYDKTGIFNIYKMNIDGSNIQQITNVLGGAFTPNISIEGKLLFSSYQKEGFAIASIEEPETIDEDKTEYIAYDKNFNLVSADPKAMIPVDGNGGHNASSDYDDTDVPTYNVSPYTMQYEKISFLPRIMRDYGTTKLGMYFYSNDVMENYSILGGVAANSDLDMDIFGIVEYKGIWPALFLEGYSQVLHHQDRDMLEIEINEDRNVEPYRQPNTLFKYKYSLMEVDAGMRTLLFNNFSKLELAFIFSRYNVDVRFPVKEYEQKQAYTYFLGRQLQLEWNFVNYPATPFADTEINPRNRRNITFRASQEFNAFIDSFKVSDYGTYVEAYENYNYTQLELDWREYIGLPFKSALDLDLHAGVITKPVHEFFNFFAGGLLGLRGFPYYSIEGRKLLIGRATYRFPVWKNINQRFLNLHFDNLYAGVFCDAGNAFNQDKLSTHDVKGNYGFEIRMDMFSFYSMPTRFFFNAAYSPQSVTKIESFSDLELKYGNEWRYYFGITFGYF